jgi:hypothetical protein
MTIFTSGNSRKEMLEEILKVAPDYKDYLSYVKNPWVVSELVDSHAEGNSILELLNDTQAGMTYAEGKWTVKDLVMHLIDSERIFNYRALCLSRGEQAELQGYDHEQYVKHASAESRSWASLLNERNNLRSSTIDLFRSFTAEQMNRSGFTNGKKVTVKALGFIIAGHEKHHLEILRNRYISVIRG